MSSEAGIKKCGLCMPGKPCHSMGCPEDWPMAEIESLKMERDHYRAALEAQVALQCRCVMQECCNCAYKLRAMAREALK